MTDQPTPTAADLLAAAPVTPSPTPAPLPKSTLPGSDTPPAAELAQVAPAALTAEVAINLVQAALIMIGEDEGILSDAEKTMLAAPLSKIIQKYNLADQMTPELEAACVVAMIVLTRLKKPKTQTWFQGMILKCRGFIVGRKIAAAVPEHEQSPAIAPPAAANP